MTSSTHVWYNVLPCSSSLSLHLSITASSFWLLSFFFSFLFACSLSWSVISILQSLSLSQRFTIFHFSFFSFSLSFFCSDLSANRFVLSTFYLHKKVRLFSDWSLNEVPLEESSFIILDKWAGSCQSVWSIYFVPVSYCNNVPLTESAD